MSWKSRARWSKKKVARLGSGSRCWSRFSSRLVYLGSFPQGVTAIAQRRGESVSGQLCRWCPRCPPPVNIHNVFRIFFGQDVISTRDLPNLQRQNCLWVLSNCQKIGLDFHFRFVSLLVEISRRQPALISRCSRGTTRLPCGTRRVSSVEIALLNYSTRQVKHSVGDVTPSNAFLGQDGNTTGRGLPKVAD